MKTRIALCGVAALLQGCTSTLRPVEMPVAANRPQLTFCTPSGGSHARSSSEIYALVPERDRLQWFSCEFRAKANANLQQSMAWANRTEWRDVPLLGAAATLVGLFLFGNRNAENQFTEGTQEAITITGYTAATFAALANYLSPANARTLLRKAARGHFCMATQADLILSVWDDVHSTERTQASTDLEGALRSLNQAIATASAGPALQQAITVRDAGLNALSLYNLQVTELRGAHVHAGEAAWSFGISLLERADRQQVDVTQLVQDITTQAESMSRFNAAEDQVNTLAPAGSATSTMNQFSAVIGEPGPTIEQRAQSVSAASRRLTSGLPNVQALAAGIATCASTALAGGEPRSSTIQYLRTD